MSANFLPSRCETFVNPVGPSYFIADYNLARDAAVCVITVGDRPQNSLDANTMLEQNLTTFKSVIPKVCKFAPNSVLLIVTGPGIRLISRLKSSYPFRYLERRMTFQWTYCRTLP